MILPLSSLLSILIIAIIHLYTYGFEGEDLLDFSLSLSNPSTVAQQQKLELFRSRFEIAGNAPQGMVDRNFLRKTIQNAHKGLKTGKFLALNVANTKQYKTFEEDTVKLAIESGFKHTDTWWLSLSTQQGKQEQGSLDGTTEVKQKQQYMGEFTRPDIAGRKFAPTFIFQK